MPESLTTKLTRWGVNFFPAFRGTGGRITCIASDRRYFFTSCISRLNSDVK